MLQPGRDHQKDAGRDLSATEVLLRRKAMREQGIRMQQFLDGDFYKEEIVPILERQKRNGLVQANQQLADRASTHAMLAACVSWHFAFDTFEKLLQDVADQARIDVTDQPADDGPDVSQ